MNKKTTKRLLALMLAAITLVLLAAPALASTRVYATTALNVRSGPGTKYSILGYLNVNQVVTKLGTSGKWTKIEFAGSTAYAYSSYLKPYSGTDTGTGTGTVPSGTVYALSDVNVRSGPGTGYTILGELRKGQAVVKVGETGTWSIINWSTGTAYVSSSYLTSTTSTPPQQQPGTSNTLYATTGVNVRKGPSTKYAVVGELVKGEGVAATGTSGKWTQVIYKGSTAYVYTKYLSSKGTQAPSQTLLYARVATELRTTPSGLGGIIGYLSAGQSVVYLGLVDNTWYKVQYGSYIAYVYGPNMQTTPPAATSGGTVYATSSVPVYNSASTSASMLGYLYAGDSAKKLGEAGSWTIINFMGSAGYVQTSRITNTPGTGSLNMTSYNRYLYSRADYVYCYSVPVEQNAYKLGYLDKGEAVYAMAGNGTWVQVLINNTVMYVPAVNLYDYGYSSSTDYAPGTRVYVNEAGGTPTYGDTSKTPFVASGESSDYGKIPYGTSLIVAQQHGSLLYVYWVDNRPGKTAVSIGAYVDMYAVRR